MKTNVDVSFDSYDIPGGAQSVFDQAQCGPDVVKIDEESVGERLWVEVTLEENDPRLRVLLDLLRQHNIYWGHCHYDVYTEEELDSARLLLMKGNGRNQIGGGVRFGTMYDLSDACSACGTGGKQTSPLFVDREDLRDIKGSRAGQTYHGRHLFVDERLAEDLERIGATGLTLNELYAEFREKRMVKLPWRQLLAARTLPPRSPRTTGFIRKDPCQVCLRNGYGGTNEEPMRVVYRSSDLRDVDDVNFSWENEWFADLQPELRESLLSWPWLLVTPKVRRVITGAGVTCFDWIPIRVEEG